MARLSPEPAQPPTGSVPGGEAPSAAAELHIMMIPSGDPPDRVPERQEIQAARNPASRLMTLMRRAGFGVRVGVTVPAANAGEMLSFCNNVGLAAVWGLTVVLTMAIMVPAGIPADVIVTTIAIELAGFVGALLLRRKHHTR